MKESSRIFRKLVRKAESFFKTFRTAASENRLISTLDPDLYFIEFRIEVALRFSSFTPEQRRVIEFYLAQLDQMATIVETIRFRDRYRQR